MAYNLDDLKLALYELFNDAADKAKQADNAMDRQSYLEQVFQTTDKIVQLETREVPPPPAL